MATHTEKDDMNNRTQTERHELVGSLLIHHVHGLPLEALP